MCLLGGEGISLFDTKRIICDEKWTFFSASRYRGIEEAFKAPERCLKTTERCLKAFVIFVCAEKVDKPASFSSFQKLDRSNAFVNNQSADTKETGWWPKILINYSYRMETWAFVNTLLVKCSSIARLIKCRGVRKSKCRGIRKKFIERVRVKDMQDNLTPLLTFLCARTNQVNYRRVVSTILHAHKAMKLFPFAVLEKVWAVIKEIFGDLFFLTSNEFM